MIFGITIAYIIIVVPYVSKKISPALPIITFILLINSIVFLLITTFTEPGIIPRKCVFELYGNIPEEYTETIEIDDIGI